MDAITLEALEFGGLKRLLGSKLRSPLGHTALQALAPSSDPEEVGLRRRRAAEALAFLRELRSPGPGTVEDPGEILTALEPEGNLPEPPRVARILVVIRAGLSWRDEAAAVRARYPRIWDLAGAVPNLRPLLNDLAGKIALDGKLEDRASTKLAELRGRIAVMEGRLQQRLRRFIDQDLIRDAIQDEFVTVRNSRFVVPVKVEARKGIPGIIHGASSTGATVFVEPLEVVELNNELVTLREEEEAEGRRILLEIGSRLRANLPELRTLCRVLGESDLLGACAIFAEEYACVPAGEGEGITLEGARHPVLEAALRERGEPIIPLDFEVPGGGRALVISGPNTGGKTVALKTAGLLAVMNQCGLLLPARHAVLPVFARILADVGDRQSITENLSTFSARMIRIGEMSGALRSPALVLLDEVGGGTDPEEEGALAVAIVDHFRRHGACVVATTHHGALKAWAEVTEGAGNASMEFDEEALAPTHRLIPGLAGRSGGLEMAARLGLPKSILEEARQRLGEAHRMVDSYLARLQTLVAERASELERARAEHERAAAEGAEARERARSEEAELRRRFDEAIAAALEKIGGAAAGIEKELTDRAAALQLRSEARLRERHVKEKLAEDLAPPAPAHPGAGKLPASDEAPAETGPVPGSRVMVRSLKSEGVVQSVNVKRRRVDLIVRNKRMTVPLSDCEPLPGGGAPLPRMPGSLPAGVTLHTERKQDVPSEINLIGRTVEEAQAAMEKFFDDVILAGHREVRIVHGHGTGRLRQAVAAFLSDHPMVLEHKPADPRAGGTGATVAVLKD